MAACCVFVVVLRCLQLLLATSVLLSCRQPNPEWLGPASVMALASTSQGSATASDSAAESGSGSSTTTAPEPTTATTDALPPAACAPEPIGGDGPCPAACDSCSAGRCRITCTEETCDSQTIACPDGWPCDVACDGKAACQDAELQCPPDRDCTVDCKGPDACNDAVVDCGSMPCRITCGPQSKACKDLLVRCGSADTHVTCQGPSELSLEDRGSSCACEAIHCG